MLWDQVYRSKAAVDVGRRTHLLQRLNVIVTGARKIEGWLVFVDGGSVRGWRLWRRAEEEPGTVLREGERSVIFDNVPGTEAR